MSKFAIGEKVDNAADDHEVGTVIAIFPTVEGSGRYGGIWRAPILCRRKISRSSRLISLPCTRQRGPWCP
jgi:hypothetical protein